MLSVNLQPLIQMLASHLQLPAIDTTTEPTEIITETGITIQVFETEVLLKQTATIVTTTMPIVMASAMVTMPIIAAATQMETRTMVIMLIMVSLILHIVTTVELTIPLPVMVVTEARGITTTDPMVVPILVAMLDAMIIKMVEMPIITLLNTKAIIKQTSNVTDA